MAPISIAEQQDIILEHEKEVAAELASKVIERPVLAWWMVLIPIFFIYYFYKFKKYTRALEDFARNLLLTRRRALQEAVDALSEKRKINVSRLLEETAGLPEKAQPAYREWMNVLTNYYRDLLASGGQNYERMAQKAYANRGNYLLICNRLNKTEKAYNRSLLPQIAGDISALRSIIEKINTEMEKIRRRDAKKFFA